ncbi:polymer-forming cytoskeletal protein [Gammaproteobacteria bacterium]|jgi:cytoskeletal protein CcmA (bactofilin family)|nr:polymer-forming cytoskeletal protein [Gammaproteobacteria bacterium]MBT6481870.1 polymer-forming cytoskeletal protein [Gammaproteobacteria bacterium]MBT7225131.1 polymer-forming cytoskeletal protein [Gammaproteobacteria bacterium]MDB3898431.1 polymer-forming cytoskeletal protein [Gammaproteobacteria bacterium]MDC0414653.1 polymer-forming cytoskeletal protein [Gammaproteobacteria bacterium]
MFKKAIVETTSTGPAHTLISRSTEIVGDIHFSGELIIEGRVKGNIYADDESQALIRIAEKGSVEGDVCVPSAIVNGLVQGDLRSSNHLELAAKAVVVGSVYYNLIEMVMGSEVNGNLMHISTSQNENKRLAAEKKKLPFDSSVIQSS